MRIPYRVVILMELADNILRQRLRNVYFLWGRGKTTIAGALNQRYGFPVYSTDAGRDRNWGYAQPDRQPFMCRDFEREYGVRSFWELPPEVIALRERHVLREVTPMFLLDLIVLAAQSPAVICEGDLDYAAVIPLASHCVHLCNRGTKFDWFDRPDHENIRESVEKRTDLSPEEKEAVIRSAYASVGESQNEIPCWVRENQIKTVIWDDSTGIPETTAEVAEYFGFAK